MFRSVLLAFALASAVTTGGCSTNKHEVKAAQHSLYDIDFAVVYSAALEATRELYPNLDDNPGNGSIKTSWHQVQYASTQDDQVGATPTGLGGNLGTQSVGTSPAAGAAGMQPRLTSKRYYIRFDVSVVGGRPWQVKVIGHASSWDPGAAMPVELHGVAKPSWLVPRVEALQVEIYKRVKKFAVPMKEDVKPDTEADVPKTDPSAFKNLPPEAAKALAVLKDALIHRDQATIRPSVADDVIWSLGGAPGVDTAMAMWQADPDSLDAMARLIGDGCAADGDKKILCPAGEPQRGQYQLVLEPRNGAWKVTSFVKAE